MRTTETPPARVPEEASGHIELLGRDGSRRLMPLSRWMGDATKEELALLDLAVGPVLDVGCGPGRHVLALAAMGIHAVGMDLAERAVDLARSRGAAAFQGSVFDHVPDEGHWGTVLLLDGNIGIGGDPTSLLGRAADLLGTGGRVLVELEPPGTPTRTRPVQCLRNGHWVGNDWWADWHAGHEHLGDDWFRWSEVSVDDIADLATAAGFNLCRAWTTAGRFFARLNRPTAARPTDADPAHQVVGR